jgi:cell fate regulator YaaT (PSP1 superfamily)
MEELVKELEKLTFDVVSLKETDYINISERLLFATNKAKGLSLTESLPFLNEYQSYAICLQTYPDENDMISFSDGDLELNKVRVYHKGMRYVVYKKGFDKNFYKLLD